ncbi:hypothetical protein [Methylacidimicrobium sp. AP8]|uniref:hypothetical protein n=1 Tax=Methylacidimicrobium sp. AP8 TaxID=2730359 RepID=UPI001924F1C8|nr:hypothetical protein [Methylacidimicrobium sp. AP8]
MELGEEALQLLVLLANRLPQVLLHLLDLPALLRSRRTRAGGWRNRLRGSRGEGEDGGENRRGDPEHEPPARPQAAVADGGAMSHGGKDQEKRMPDRFVKDGSARR